MALLPRGPDFLSGKMPHELVRADDWHRRIAMLVSAVLIGDWAGSIVCRDKLYLVLSRGFLPPEKGEEKPA